MARKKTILVTGALGHIGSRLIREFSPRTVGKIILLDNLSTQRYTSLFDLPKGIQYQFVEADIRTVDLKKLFRGVDVVVHLAALTDAANSHDRAGEVMAVNFEGTKRVAEACRENKARLLFPSTTSVYGVSSGEVDETSKELKPQSPYAESKLHSEEYLRGLGKKGLRFVICRLGTIFGWSIGMRFHTAVNKFTWQAVMGQPLTVWKTAWRQKRPYLYLGDCVRAINFIIERDVFDGEMYNVLTKNFTVEDIVETIRKFRPKLKVSFVESRIMNQLSYEVVDKKFREKGFQPRGNLKKGVRETVAHLNAMAR